MNIMLPDQGKPVADTDQQPFVAFVSDSYPQAFNFLMAALQRQIFTLNSVLDIEGNTSTPSSLLVSYEVPSTAALQSQDSSFPVLPSVAWIYDSRNYPTACQSAIASRRG